MPEINTILSPVDFSGTSEYALQYAVDLASQLNAEVKVIHVYQFPAFTVPESEFVAPLDSDFEADYPARLQEQVDNLVERYVSSGVKVTGGLAEGVPYSEIVRAAKELSADLIVLGTHGRTGLAHLLLGSVAERVVRLSPIPVLTVRHTE